MKKRILKKIGMIVVVFVVGFLVTKCVDSPKEEITKTNLTVVSEEEKTDESIMKPESKNEEEEQVLDIKSISESELMKLKITKEQIADSLQNWVNRNGYYTATGAEFKEEYVKMGGKTSMKCKLLFEDRKEKPAEDVWIIMDVFDENQLVSFHK